MLHNYMSNNWTESIGDEFDPDFCNHSFRCITPDDRQQNSVRAYNGYLNEEYSTYSLIRRILKVGIHALLVLVLDLLLSVHK